MHVAEARQGNALPGFFILCASDLSGPQAPRGSRIYGLMRTRWKPRQKRAARSAAQATRPAVRRTIRRIIKLLPRSTSCTKLQPLIDDVWVRPQWLGVGVIAPDAQQVVAKVIGRGRWIATIWNLAKISSRRRRRRCPPSLKKSLRARTRVSCRLPAVRVEVHERGRTSGSRCGRNCWRLRAAIPMRSSA